MLSCRNTYTHNKKIEFRKYFPSRTLSEATLMGHVTGKIVKNGFHFNPQMIIFTMLLTVIKLNPVSETNVFLG